MPEYSFTSPEGKAYSITGPEGSTREQAFQLLPMKYPELKGQPGFEGAKPSAPGAAPAPAPQLTPQQAAKKRVDDIFAKSSIKFPLQPGYGEGLLELPDKLGAAVTDLAAKAGVKPEIAAGLGVAANLGTLAIPIGEGGKLAKAGLETVTGLAGKAVDLYRGTAVKATTKEAANLVKGEANKLLAGTKKSGLEELAIARHNERIAADAEAARAHLEQQLKAASAKGTQSLGATGDLIRDAVKIQMGQAAAYRAQQGEMLFSAAKEAALKKEAAGSYLNTADAFKPVDELLANVKGVPGLESKIEGLAQLLRPREQEAGKVLLRDVSGHPLIVEPAKSTPITFEQAEIARRYLNDIAYGADLEGYPAIARTAAKEAAKKLDAAMGEFVPQFKSYKQGWAELSKPLEAKGTRFGKAVFGAEGGVKSDAYQKISSEQLPAKFFSNSEGVKALMDSLAGGKGASEEARAHASKLVQDLAMKYFMEKTRPMEGAALEKFVQSPEVRDTLGELPKVGAALKGKASGMTAREQGIRTLAEQAKTAQAQAQAAQARRVQVLAQRQALAADLSRADVLAASKSLKGQSEAATAYKQILTKAHKNGTIPTEKYQAIMTVFDQLQSQKEAADFVRKAAHATMWLTGAGVVGGEAVMHKMAAH
jgi:hypothetical protein